MSTLTNAEIAAKTDALKVLQKELGWLRVNAKPVIIGAVIGALAGFLIAHIL